MTWGDRTRKSQTILDLPRGFGQPVDMSSVLDVLATAGLPGEVTSFNQATLADGRVVALTTSSPFWPVVAIDEIPPRTDVALFADRDIPEQLIQVARTVPGILLVDLSRRQVWDNGRLLNGTCPHRGASRYRHSVFAVARLITRFGGTTEGIASRGALTTLQVRDSLDVLEDHIKDTQLGWEAKNPDSLIEWTCAAYPGPGGALVHWASDLPIDEQARRLRMIPGVLLSGLWAGHRSDSRIPALSISVFARNGLDLDPFGFRPATWRDSTVLVFVPEDRTIFGTAQFMGPAGCTDEYITASLLEHRWTAHTEEEPLAAAILRDRLLWQHELHYDLRWDLPN